ncbi:MAG: thiamine phosphate synthase [Sulfurovum sp.]|nr:thiamine phosphate synthase [Sulfurovum sp.]
MRFLDCGTKPLGIYPVVDRAYKLEALYQAGITTAQLRTKDKFKGQALEDEVIEAIKISKHYKARFFLNDFWELGIKHKVYGIHLGQEDIQEADVEAIYRAGIRLGISTHTRDEIEIAMAFEPSYLAIGPIYEPISKKLTYDPVGIEDLKHWAKNVTYPIVAIGGITIENIKDVAQTKAASGIAMISDVLEGGEVSQKRTTALMRVFEKYAR